LRTEDCGLLWEHLVLESLLARDIPRVHHWRDKQQREVDFIIPRRGGAVDAIECKWRAASVEGRGLKAFRTHYPKGRNFLVAPIMGKPYDRRVDGLDVTVISPKDLRP
jgi:predicted AAA+ superfamily ATPase